VRIGPDCAAVFVDAKALYPIGLGLPPLPAQPLGQLGQRAQVVGGRVSVGLLDVGLAPGLLAQPLGQLGQRARVAGGATRSQPPGGVLPWAASS
jgi:hypothetical protein